MTTSPDDAPSNEATDRSHDATETSGAPFPIVGIGASAGGLAAFEAFFSGMPADNDSGMAFILVQHLAPDHESILVDLVKRYTRMPVFEVEDGMRVAPNCAYIIPPNRDIALLHGVLQLLEPVAPHGQRLSIDFFFRSLAHDQRERAICVILSGSGSDGTQGLRAIKAEGGMAMAQNPASTEYDSMPSSAIATGLVDYTLPPAEMPAQLLAYVKRASGQKSLRPSPAAPKVDDALKKVLILLRGHTGHDFSHYKQNTVSRRIERRMAVQQIEQPEEYLRFARESPAELDALFGDLLIGVTNFFRDTEAFDVVQQHIAQLLATKPAGSLVRVWTTGCSTGEEAYSLAILFREQMEATKQRFKLQVFATDIDSRAIDVARAGVYPSSIAADVSSERLARFFSQDGDFYRINKNIRDTLVFSEHDLIRDPPFSKLDLISCRNLLIYLGPELQRTLIPLFHYGLNPGGSLFLGSSETIGEFAELFAPLERKAKLYQRLDAQGASRPVLGEFLPRTKQPRSTSSTSSAERRAPREPELPLRELTERLLLARAPVGTLVNERGDLLYVHGYTGKYLQPAPGEAGLSILKMARDGLARQLTSALERAAVENEPVCYPRLRVKTDGAVNTVNLTVQPVSVGAATAADTKLFLVTFEEVASIDETQERTGQTAAEVTDGPDARIATLMQELRAKDEHLRSVQEEMQTANEELTSSNEELQSTNEELQSTNEELETSKEELQSVNEELATVNSELQNKVVDLSRANNDMNNLLAGTGVGTIFVDHQLCIQRFTPAATLLVNLIRSDVGRPLGHIVSNLLDYDRLVEDVRNVLETLVPKEVQVKARPDAWYLLSIRPYRTLENVVEGAVITFTEITLQKRAQAALLEHETLRRMAAVMRDARDAITVQDLDGRILAWNRCAETLYGWSEAEALNMNIRELIPDTGREAAASLVRRLAQAEVIEPFKTLRLTKDSNIVQISMTATALVNESGAVYAVCTTERELATAPNTAPNATDGEVTYARSKNALD
jgi:two-component system CheB/CheR fusion protein